MTKHFSTQAISKKTLQLFGFKTQRTGSESLQHPTTIKVVKKSLFYWILRPGRLDLEGLLYQQKDKQKKNALVARPGSSVG